MADTAAHLARLRACPRGDAGWREFEDACTDILQHLFVPPLEPPHIQARRLGGTEVRDALQQRPRFRPFLWRLRSLRDRTRCSALLAVSSRSGLRQPVEEITLLQEMELDPRSPGDFLPPRLDLVLVPLPG